MWVSSPVAPVSFTETRLLPWATFLPCYKGGHISICVFLSFSARVPVWILSQYHKVMAKNHLWSPDGDPFVFLPQNHLSYSSASVFSGKFYHYFACRFTFIPKHHFRKNGVFQSASTVLRALISFVSIVWWPAQKFCVVCNFIPQCVGVECP